MDLRHLRTLCAVVDHGSFSAAAESLGVSQPAVSAQMRSLEKEVGRRLLDRDARRPVPTEAGLLVYEQGRRMLDLADGLERQLDGFDDTVGGDLDFGSSTGPGELFLPSLCIRFHERFPEVRVRLHVDDTRGIGDRVLRDELELGIVGAARDQRGLEFSPLMRDELVLITPPDHALAERDGIALAELAELPVIMQQKGSGVRSVVEAAMRADGLAFAAEDARLELGLQQSVKAAVLEGLGISIVSRLAVSREVADGRLAAVPLTGAGIAREFQVVRRAGRTPTRAGEAFLTFCRETLAGGGDQ